MALDSPREIFDESDVSDWSSTVVEPSTSTRAPSPEPTPPPTPSTGPRSPTPDAAPGPAAETPDRDSDKAVRNDSAPGDRDSEPENKGSDTTSEQRDETRTDMPVVAPVPDQQTLPTMPKSPGHNFLFDLGIPRLTSSPDKVTPTRKRSRDEFEADLSDSDFSLGSEALGIWGPAGESGSALSRSVPIGGNVGDGAGASAVPETDSPEGKGAESEKGRDAGSSTARSCKRRRI